MTQNRLKTENQSLQWIPEGTEVEGRYTFLEWKADVSKMNEDLIGFTSSVLPVRYPRIQWVHLHKTLRLTSILTEQINETELKNPRTFLQPRKKLICWILWWGGKEHQKTDFFNKDS
ncbi:hypothetical protein Y1Q_0009166 [Alligator mississippiensis]|uniref:Uncharacterized protein n=1 Tax=Alligator mississippiensis TaxID=8496 RepID=A0A151M2N7_ALLMI|nr:hypothetical protein Y1Q_0009166 [Alligator mississippiensis]